MNNLIKGNGRMAVAAVTLISIGAVIGPGLAGAAGKVTSVVVKNKADDPVPVEVAGTPSVSVSNLPATQSVSGTVDVGNLPATQEVTGEVTIPEPEFRSGNRLLDEPSETFTIQAGVVVTDIIFTYAGNGNGPCSPVTAAINGVKIFTIPAATAPGGGVFNGQTMFDQHLQSGIPSVTGSQLTFSVNQFAAGFCNVEVGWTGRAL